MRAIEAAGGEAFALRADVAEEAEVVSMFAQLEARFGRLDALVNNAGILARQMRVDEMDAARIARIMMTNVVGSFLCAREAVRRMSTSTAAAAAPSSTSPRARRFSVRRANTSTMRPRKRRSTR